MSTPAQKARPQLRRTQEGLCGICWRPLQQDIDTDHILPQVWHDKLRKPGKNRADNLQAVHVECNRMKGSYPSLWHRHTLKLCLALIRGGTPNTEPVLWKLAGPVPAFQNRKLQNPERVCFASAYGLIVPYIHKFFDRQNLQVPANIRSDRFLKPFLDWVNTEPMRTQHHVERAGMHAEAAAMWDRAAEHACRVPQPGEKRSIRLRHDEPVGGVFSRFRELLDNEAVPDGVMAYGIPAYARHRGTQPKQARQLSRRLALAAPATQPTTLKQTQQAASGGCVTVQIVARSCDTRQATQ